MAARQVNSLRVLGFPVDLEQQMTLAAMAAFPGRKDFRRAWLVDAVREKLAREAQGEGKGHSQAQED